jgi:hypothetical protein
LAVVAISVSSHSVPKFGFLPFTDENMIKGLIALGVVGLISVFLAVTRIFRYLFPVWAAIVLWLLIKGFILSPFTFPNAAAFHNALWLIFVAFVAFIGALWFLKRRQRF